jgi:hypothetical protein
MYVYVYVWMYVHTYACMCASLAPERMYEFYSYSAFNNLSLINQCQRSMNLTAPETGTLQIGTQKQNDDFVETVMTVLITFRKYMKPSH